MKKENTEPTVPFTTTYSVANAVKKDETQIHGRLQFINRITKIFGADYAPAKTQKSILEGTNSVQEHIMLSNLTIKSPNDLLFHRVQTLVGSKDNRMEKRNATTCTNNRHDLIKEHRGNQYLDYDYQGPLYRRVAIGPQSDIHKWLDANKKQFEERNHRPYEVAFRTFERRISFGNLVVLPTK